jgi:peptidoglycan/LPS O-acetylase OafA/YrhL
VVLFEGGTETLNAPQKKARAYYGDWVRSIAISLVIFVHTLGVSYDSSGYNKLDAWKDGQDKMHGIWKDLV